MAVRITCIDCGSEVGFNVDVKATIYFWWGKLFNEVDLLGTSYGLTTEDKATITCQKCGRKWEEPMKVRM